MKNFTNKYKPLNLSDIPQDTTKLKESILKKNNVLIVGPPGSCKTSSVYAIVNELDYEILELNASDWRNKGQIESIIGEAVKQKSLFNKEKIILMDEADGLSGDKDRGGASALAALLKETKIPIVITANNNNSEKLKEIKKLVTVIEFQPVISKRLIAILEEICKKENIEYSQEDLRKIAINCNGDIRAALNDLESCSPNKKLQKDMLTSREYEINIVNALSIVFKTRSITANFDLEKLNVDLDEYSLWLDENIPLEYKDYESLESAYNKFSKADIFKKRILKRQYWRLLYYQNLLLTSGISLSKIKTNSQLINYKRSMRILRIWQSNMKNSKKKSIAEKLSKQVHISAREIIKSFNYYREFIKNENVAKEMGLNEEEIEYLNKD